MNSIFPKKSIVSLIISDSETLDNQLINGLKKRFNFFIKKSLKLCIFVFSYTNT